MTRLIEHILHLSGWVALLIVFAVPALESSLFLGFVFPGETALILGGVLASYGRVSLWAVLVAGISGAIIGDSVGYLVGREYGRRVLQARPLRRFLKPQRIERAEGYLARRGGRAVFFGRFTAALRVMVPGLAGMARMRYRVFLPFNVAGGAIWGGVMVLLGYIAGASWKQVARYATQVGIALFVVVVLTLILGHLLRTAGDPQSWAGRQVARLAGSRAVSWLRARFPGQLGWLAARFQTGVAAGFALTVAVLTLAACAWSLGSLTFSVVHHINSARFDPRVLSFFVDHRTPWITSLARALTWLGSGFVLWPVVIAAGLGLWWWRRQWLPAVLPALSLAGAGAWCLLAKGLVGRPRPPAGDWLGAFDGWSYPSQHAAQALATWGMLALMVMAGRSLRTRTLLMTGAALIAFVVGLTRLYLAAHWMTDVLAGWALAGVWGCLLIISYLFAQQAATASTEREARPAARPGAAGPGKGAPGPLPADRTAPADDHPLPSCSRPERAIGCIEMPDMPLGQPDRFPDSRDT
jgi:membrane protein DedA with SNARE-associated domain/membrane-associated phospholipid phosphatase